jgi:RNA-splicing ligase RtcB
MHIIDGARVPIYSWAAEVEDQALRLARNVGNLELAIDHAALMPDAHSGSGMPIGGVLFAEGAVVPYAIGVDIGWDAAASVTLTTLLPADTELRVGCLDDLTPPAEMSPVVEGSSFMFDVMPDGGIGASRRACPSAP